MRQLVVKETENGVLTFSITGEKGALLMKYFLLLASAIATGVIAAKAVRTYAA